MRISLVINEKQRELDIQPGETLYEVIKKCGISSVKKSCGTGSCGVCTVLLDGKPVPSCSYLAAKASGHAITTIEGLETEAEVLGTLMNQAGAVQCGYSTPGFMLTAIAAKRELVEPTEEEMKQYLIGNLCRCSGYEGQLRALKRYMEVSQ